MVCAGIDVTKFKPQSTSGVSTSKAFHLGILLSDILKQGQWPNAKHFSVFVVEKLRKRMAGKHE